MNKRMNELAEQAEQSVKWGDPHNYDDYNRAFDEWQEKFAELIVAECIKVIETNHPEFDCKESADNLIRRAGSMDAIDEISKHFGVEE